MNLEYFIVPAAAYLIGAIPFGYLIGRLHGIDIRKVGSGNIGATNVTRTVGKIQGKICFLLDFLKGALPVALVNSVFMQDTANLALAAGLAVILGPRPATCRSQASSRRRHCLWRRRSSSGSDSRRRSRSEHRRSFSSHSSRFWRFCGTSRTSSGC